MSELMMGILNDNPSTEEVVRWLLSDDMTVQKEGYSKSAFARYLLDCIRKLTFPLLVIPEPNVVVVDTPTSKPFTSTPLGTPSHESTQIYKSTFSNSASIESRSPTPVQSRNSGSSRSRTSFNSPWSTPVSQNTSVSSPSMELLERRLTSRDNSRNSPKQLLLKDFIVTKEKPPKRKKRVKPSPCGSNEMQENVSVTSPIDLTKIGEERAMVKRVTPVLCSRVQESQSNENEPIRILKRVPFAQVDEQIQQISPKKLTNSHISILGSSPRTAETSNVSTNAKLAVDMSLVKEDRKLLIQKLASLYSAVLSSNYTQDLLKELNYLMSLLSSSVKPEKNELSSSKAEDGILLDDGRKIDSFKTNEEGIYFSATVLELQWNLLKQLTTAMLSILAELLTPVVPEFADRISNHIEKRKSTSQNVSIVDHEMLSNTVKFKMDTDCRPNYLNDQLFYAFKKQRDEFYSLMQEWEDETNRGQRSADFFKAKLKKLRLILTASTASTIMFRLADLFVSQILASVFNENKDSKEKLTVDGITSSKFDKLNQRIVGPGPSVNEKRFPGVQEFFKDFLRSSSAENSFFTSHVRDVLIQRITTLNSINISCETSVASVRQELYLVCANKLCLLAKFLSLICFLPYQDKDKLPPHLLIPLVDARKNTLPPLDLDELLTKAIETGRILITVPWIVEFMNGIDDTSIQLPCYKIILSKLQYLLYKIRLPSNNNSCERFIFCIYSNDVKNSVLNENDGTKGNSEEITDNRMNMLQLKEFASKTTSDLTKQFVDECLQTIECSRILITLYVNTLFNNISVSTIINMEYVTELPVLFSSEFYINNTALYQSFPQLNELKSILEGRRKLSCKSVTLKTEKTFCDHQNLEVALEMQLEMHFFDNMSHSVKSTVDIVAKQISSHCISAIRDKTIPELKTQLYEHLKTALLNETCQDEVTHVMLAKFYGILRQAVKKELSTLYKDVESSLAGMLKPDVREDLRIFSICVDVTCRKCIEITYNWIFNYINFEGMVEEGRRIVVEEIARMKSNVGRANEDKKSKKSKNHVLKNEFDALMMPKSQVVSWTTPGPVQILHRLRHLTRIVIANSKVNISHKDAYCLRSEIDVNLDDIVCLIQDTISCIEHRVDLQFIAFRRVMLISLDMVAILVFFRPDLVINKTMQLFAKMWTYRKDCKLHLHFEKVLCSRNIEIYSKQDERMQKDICRCLDTYLCFMLENKMLHTSRLFRQLLKLLQQEWPIDEFLRPILICVKEALQKCCPHKQKIISALESITTTEEEWQ